VCAWNFSFTLRPPSALSLVQINTHLKRSHKQTLVYSINQPPTFAGLGTVVVIIRVASLQCFFSSLLLCSLLSFYSSSVSFFIVKVQLIAQRKTQGITEVFVAYMESLKLPKGCRYNLTKMA